MVEQKLGLGWECPRGRLEERVKVNRHRWPGKRLQFQRPQGFLQSLWADFEWD